MQENKNSINSYSEWIGVPDLNCQGFIYRITNLTNGKYYIGKKFYHSKKIRKPLKGNTNKRHYIVESDWRDYWGSCKALQEDIQKFGKHNFKREILLNCMSRWECAYYEAKFQFKFDVLLDKNCYNSYIRFRLVVNK